MAENGRMLRPKMFFENCFVAFVARNQPLFFETPPMLRESSKMGKFEESLKCAKNAKKVNSGHPYVWKPCIRFVCAIQCINCTTSTMPEKCANFWITYARYKLVSLRFISKWTKSMSEKELFARSSWNYSLNFYFKTLAETGAIIERGKSAQCTCSNRARKFSN